MQKSLFISIPAALVLMVMPVHADGNPYPTNGYYWGNCTWGAWQLVYEKLGAEMPGMGNAQEWYANAQADGYAVGSEPMANSIVVWSGGRSGLGHVAYVDFVNDDGTVFIEEGSGANHNYTARTADPENCGMTLLGYIYVSSDTSPVAYDLSEASLLNDSDRRAVNDAIEAYEAAHDPVAVYAVTQSVEDPAYAARPAMVSPSLSEPESTAPAAPSLSAIDTSSRVIIAD